MPEPTGFVTASPRYEWQRTACVRNLCLPRVGDIAGDIDLGFHVPRPLLGVGLFLPVGFTYCLAIWPTSSAVIVGRKFHSIKLYLKVTYVLIMTWCFRY
jgi:hypothetical protein